METATSKASEEAQIREVIEDWFNALRAKDPDKMTSNYSPDIIVFAAAPPLEITGVQAYRTQWQGMFNSIDGPVGCEIRDLKITARGDVAFSHCLNRLTGKTKDGSGNFPWVRVTLCFRKVGGTWMVTHEHASVPFDPQSGKASLDLKP